MLATSFILLSHLWQNGTLWIQRPFEWGSGIREERWWGLAGKRLLGWQSQVRALGQRTAHGRKEWGRTQGLGAGDSPAGRARWAASTPSRHMPWSQNWWLPFFFSCQNGHPWALESWWLWLQRGWVCLRGPHWSSGGGRVWGWACILGLTPSALFLQDHCPAPALGFSEWSAGDTVPPYNVQRGAGCTHGTLACSWKCQSLSRVWLFATPWTVAPQTPLSIGILQAGIPEWVAMPFSRGSSRPRDQTRISHLVGRFFTVWATREAPQLFIFLQCLFGD